MFDLNAHCLKNPNCSPLMQMSHIFASRFATAVLYMQCIFDVDHYNQALKSFKYVKAHARGAVKLEHLAAERAVEFIQTYCQLFDMETLRVIVCAAENEYSNKGIWKGKYSIKQLSTTCQTQIKALGENATEEAMLLSFSKEMILDKVSIKYNDIAELMTATLNQNNEVLIPTVGALEVTKKALAQLTKSQVLEIDKKVASVFTITSSAKAVFQAGDRVMAKKMAMICMDAEPAFFKAPLPVLSDLENSMIVHSIQCILKVQEAT